MDANETLEKPQLLWPHEEHKLCPLAQLKQPYPFEISVLLPTRGRKEPLEQCLRTLIDTAADPNAIEILIAFDDDDRESIEYFNEHITKYLNEKTVSYTVVEFKRLGYLRLNEYLNELAKHSSGRWLFFWNDDAVMSTQGWDSVITSYNGNFNVLRAETNHSHPYAIFPILPRLWVELTGHLSPHQINDAWISQVGWLLDIVVTIPVMIDHERHDLTGHNHDDTYKERVMLEGNPSNPADFNSKEWHQRRMGETQMIAEWLEKQDIKLPRWELIKEQKVDPWEEMIKLDVKGQMSSFKIQY